jgi:hypothetical protein
VRSGPEMPDVRQLKLFRESFPARLIGCCNADYANRLVAHLLPPERLHDTRAALYGRQRTRHLCFGDERHVDWTSHGLKIVRRNFFF